MLTGSRYSRGWMTWMCNSCYMLSSLARLSEHVFELLPKILPGIGLHRTKCIEDLVLPVLWPCWQFRRTETTHVSFGEAGKADLNNLEHFFSSFSESGAYRSYGGDVLTEFALGSTLTVQTSQHNSCITLESLISRSEYVSTHFISLLREFGSYSDNSVRVLPDFLLSPALRLTPTRPQTTLSLNFRHLKPPISSFMPLIATSQHSVAYKIRNYRLLLLSTYP
jgi:hypothetical protein